MSEKKDFDIKNEGQTLDIDQAKNMTVGEAVRKDSEIKAGVTENDSILDKYIKQHREEVASKKFETKATELEELDTASLDQFIKKQREELAQAGLVGSQVEPSTETADVEPTTDEEVLEQNSDSVDATPQKEGESPKSNRQFDQVNYPEEQVFESARKDSQAPKKKKWLLALLLLALLCLASFFGLKYINQSNSDKPKEDATKQTSKSKREAGQAKKDKENAKIFNNAFNDFYTDDKHTKLKNDQFSKLTDLEKALSKLEKSAYYDKAKEKFDLLSKQIAAIEAVNAKFSSQAIKDGEKVKTTVKSGANFDDLKANTLKTGNASLDSLLQTIISEGRKQLSDKEKAEKAAEEKATAEKAAEEKKAAEAATANQSDTSNNNSTNANATNPAPANPGVAMSNSAGLQRDLSRVPYNSAAIADSGNAAWLFNPGVLERVVSTSQARGYFTGSNYVLEPVNIVNGNGYYNMFKTDGTYLFTINCKTGYFVGNAKGHSDGLDY